MFLTQKQLRELGRANPFRPFRLYLTDGRTLRVPHPDFLLAGIEQVVIATELPHEVPGELNIVPYEQIVRLEFLTPRRKNAA